MILQIKNQRMKKVVRSGKWVLLLSLFCNYIQAQIDSTTPPNIDNLGIVNPSNITETVDFDAATNQYIITKKVGSIIISTEYISAEEYRRMKMEQSTSDYWKDKETATSQGKEENSLIPPININNDIFKNIFGSSKIEIKPQGTAELILGVRSNRTDNPNIPVQQRTVTTFNFDQNIQLSLNGKIGDKINLTANFNTKAVFNFENQLNLKFQGGEDDILQTLEFGNVQLPLTGTLIQGSTALFGVKTKLKFGKLEATIIGSQQQGQKQNIQVQGGAQVTNFEIQASNYEANRHYFLSDYFMNNYDNFNRNLPFVVSPIQITRIEVWITNRVNAVENVRNIVAMMPLGENLPNSNVFPQNAANPDFDPQNLNQGLLRDVTSQYLFNQLQPGIQIEKLANARLLNPNEYTLDPILGYISLNQSLNADEVLAVAYQYTVGGETYQVGEFGTDIAAPNALAVKLLKASNLDVRQPTWNWMMKNIYSIGGYNIGAEDFTLNLLYQDTETGIKVNYFPNAGTVSGTPLLQLFRLDRLNPQNDQMPDGFFDFIDGKTIRTQNGKIIFPVKRPFSTGFLQEVFVGNSNATDLIQRYAFDSLYTTIQQLAELNQEKNRFYIGGSYKGASGNEISLNAFNVPQGSVTVSAGGKTLTEGVDYTVDYSAGKVRIINESVLNSGLPINISLENNSTFNIQQKTLIGAHFDYKFSKNFQIGATIMNLNERPLTSKIDIGNEPTSNTIWGMDVNYSTESNFITRLVDKIPGINTKAPSKFSFNGEFAHLIPGFNTVINQGAQENGVSQIDDFEGAETPIDIRNPFFWRLGSVPQENPRFPNGNFFDDLQGNYNRAKMSWFIQDPLFYRLNSFTPDIIKNNFGVMTNNYLREIDIREVFPGFQPPLATNPITTQQVLDIHFYPDERGPYNYDANALDETVTDKIVLKNPKSNFGSMMRRMETTDWDGANVAYIEFWMMDPFTSDLNEIKEFDDGAGATNKNLDPGGGGNFIIQIGNMSEDVLRDGRLSYENGLSTPTQTRPTVNTAWGRMPLLQPINNNFDNDPETRVLQDVGYDGLSDTAEATFFSNYVNAAFTKYGISGAYDDILEDPSGDNYRHFTGSTYDPTTFANDGYPHQRYKKFLSPENNSPAGSINESFQQQPNTEDINQNFTLDQPEGYYQYAISLRPDDLTTIGENYITDIRNATSKPYNVNGVTVTKNVRWIQFRIPIRSEEKEQFGNINNFRSIRYMRMVTEGFPDDVFIRLATLQLVRGDWRAYETSLWDPEAFNSVDVADFNATTVNIEENSGKSPFKYAMPPGVTRENDPSQPQVTQLNEQALVLNVCNLQDGESKSVFKNTEYDFRAYKNIKMWIHGEEALNNPLDSSDLSVFIRLGMDATENYYEIEVPLILSNPSIQPSNSAKTPSDDTTYRRNVWANQINFILEKLPELKLDRNSAGVASNQVFSKMDGEQRITVVGNPNIANIRSIMIGVRNPHKKRNPWQTGQNGTKQDDGLPKCGQIWVNELRVTDYFEVGGFAAKVRTQIDLADFGQISAAVSHTTFGFGSIEQKPLQRTRNNTTTFDITTQFEFGKFFGQKAGVTIPIFFGYSTSIADPQFNPGDPDVRFNRALDNLFTDLQRDSMRNVSQQVSTRTTFNITNMKKNRTNSQKKINFWDIENWDFSYSYQNETYRDIRTVKNNTEEHRGSLGYVWAPNVKYWEPFKKSKMKSKWLKWLKEFNFTWMPKRLAARVNIVRDVNEFLLRNTTPYDLLILPTYKKNFTWVRTYELQYAPFKSVTLTFTATNNSRVDEPEMKLDNSIRPKNPFFGRNTMYTHNFDINYQIPFSKIPLLDWLSGSIGYGGNYKWTSGTMERDLVSNEFRQGRFGNVAQNSTTLKANAQVNLTTLYNKVPFLKKLFQPKKDEKKKDADGDDEPEEKKFKVVKWKSKKTASFKKDKKKLIKHNLKTLDVTVKVIDGDGKEVIGKTEVVDEDKVRFIANEDAKNCMIYVEGKKEKKKFRWQSIPEGIAKLVLGLKNVTFSYTESNGTVLPGYKAGTSLLGMDIYNDGVDVGFVFGRQYNDLDLFNKVLNNNWFVRDTSLNVLFTRTHSSNVSINGTYEPFKGFRATLTATRQFTENYQSNYRFVNSLNDFQRQNPQTTGNFTISTNLMATSFTGIDANFQSQVFRNLLDYRSIISNRLAQLNTDPTSVFNPLAQYQYGYGNTQQDVLLYSFLAAYQGRNPSDMNFDLFPVIPIPNWRVQIDGLKDIPFIKKVFKNFVIAHGYNSTMTLAGFQSNFVYNNQDPNIFVQNPFQLSQVDNNGNYIGRYFMNSVSLNEQYNPLIKIDMTFHNTVQASVEIKSSRTIALNFPNSQVTETSTFEIAVGGGYTIKDLKLPIRIGGKQVVSNLNLRADFGLRDNSTVIRKIDTEVEQVTAGQRAITIKVFAEYAFTKNVTARLFYDQNINNPFVANQFPTSNINTGLSVRFTLTP